MALTGTRVVTAANDEPPLWRRWPLAIVAGVVVVLVVAVLGVATLQRSERREQALPTVKAEQELALLAAALQTERFAAAEYAIRRDAATLARFTTASTATDLGSRSFRAAAAVLDIVANQGKWFQADYSAAKIAQASQGVCERTFLLDANAAQRAVRARAVPTEKRSGPLAGQARREIEYGPVTIGLDEWLAAIRALAPVLREVEQRLVAGNVKAARG